MLLIFRSAVQSRTREMMMRDMIVKTDDHQKYRHHQPDGINNHQTFHFLHIHHNKINKKYPHRQQC